MIIYTRKGEEILISDIDSDLYDKYNLRINSDDYVSFWDGNKNKLLHQIILERMLGFNIPQGVMPDHINRNKLDCRRSNIRPATSRLNSYNRTKNKKTSSYLEGVSFNKQTGRWISVIGCGGHYKHIGRFKTQEEAHSAYSDVKRKYIIFETDKLGDKLHMSLVGGGLLL